MNEIIRIEDLAEPELETTAKDLVALWVVLMKKVKVPKADIPKPRTAELNLMKSDVDKLLVKYRRFPVDQITVHWNAMATEYAVKIAEKRGTKDWINPTITIGDLYLWMKTIRPAPDYTLKALPSDGLTEEQRAKGWKSDKDAKSEWEGDPLEVAIRHAPKLLELCENGFAYIAKGNLLHPENAEVFTAICKAIPADEMEVIEAETMQEWRNQVLDEFPAAKFAKDGEDLRPDQVLTRLIDRNIKGGGNAESIIRGFPDYRTIGIEPILRAFVKAQGITKMEKT